MFSEEYLAPNHLIFLHESFQTSQIYLMTLTTLLSFLYFPSQAIHSWPVFQSQYAPKLAGYVRVPFEQDAMVDLRHNTHGNITGVSQQNAPRHCQLSFIRSFPSFLAPGSLLLIYEPIYSSLLRIDDNTVTVLNQSNRSPEPRFWDNVTLVNDDISLKLRLPFCREVDYR
jgi:hypothetical protein